MLALCDGRIKDSGFGMSVPLYRKQVALDVTGFELCLFSCACPCTHRLFHLFRGLEKVRGLDVYSNEI